jgi:hypothetical protein
MQRSPISAALLELSQLHLASSVGNQQLIDAFIQLRKELIEARAYTLLDTHADAAVYNATMMSHIYGQIEFADIILQVLCPPPVEKGTESNASPQSF